MTTTIQKGKMKTLRLHKPVQKNKRAFSTYTKVCECAMFCSEWCDKSPEGYRGGASAVSNYDRNRTY